MRSSGRSQKFSPSMPQRKKRALDDIPTENSVPLRVGFQFCLLIRNQSHHILRRDKWLRYSHPPFSAGFQGCCRFRLRRDACPVQQSKLSYSFSSVFVAGSPEGLCCCCLVQAHSDGRYNPQLSGGEVGVVGIHRGQAVRAESVLFKFCKGLNQTAEGA